MYQNYYQLPNCFRTSPIPPILADPIFETLPKKPFPIIFIKTKYKMENKECTIPRIKSEENISLKDIEKVTKLFNSLEQLKDPPSETTEESVTDSDDIKCTCLCKLKNILNICDRV